MNITNDNFTDKINLEEEYTKLQKDFCNNLITNKEVSQKIITDDIIENVFPLKNNLNLNELNIYEEINENNFKQILESKILEKSTKIHQNLIPLNDNSTNPQISTITGGETEAEIILVSELQGNKINSSDSYNLSNENINKENFNKKLTSNNDNNNKTNGNIIQNNLINTSKIVVNGKLFFK